MTGITTMDAVPVVHVNNQLGECPLWHIDEQALFWVDILDRTIFRLKPAGAQVTSYKMENRVTALGLRAKGGFVVTFPQQVGYWSPGTGKFDSVARLTGKTSGIRFNDGAVDRRGRFWVGTMNEDTPDSTEGCLYRLSPTRKVLEKMDAGYTISNGIGWSPDDRIMYFTDTSRRVIWAYDYDLDSGSISNRRPFVYVPSDAGMPDGLTVDSEGSVWSAHWGGWRVSRYSPDGRLQMVVRLPVENVTSCAFGGANLDDLYITTAWTSLTKEQRRAQTMSGHLFHVRAGVRGLAESSCAG